MKVANIVNGVALAVLFVCVMLIMIDYVYSQRRQRRLQAQRAEEHSGHRHNTAGEQSHLRLMRQAVRVLLTHKLVDEGIPLASSFGVSEVMADRELRSNRNRGRPPRLTMADGTRDTITEVVRRARAAGPLPDSPPGPALMELLEALRERQQREAATQPFSESDRTPLEELIDGLVKAEEEVQYGAGPPSDAEALYGAAAPYTPNPANECICCNLSCGDDDETVFSPN
ncbi:unnamed protein product [Trypanosoma congolense IL3000]|uniref:WGS project CAEQ00000000 data, annotated contig 1575 n=1 Tax=Trypanosoma congolense (strain IL3000) TaxID=1068625 RepID=F9W763_TRYCI|nr:unnamed protein product [Trypanosoma congolense IL3000]